MARKVAELKALLKQDDLAEYVGNLWTKLNNNRQDKLREWLELRNYIFATDTRTTSNSSLPWKNNTTTPKLCQIRDNLHSNYISALFPNDNWLSWEAYTPDSAKHDTAKAIQGYMENKCRIGNFRAEVSKLLYDYIDYGNAFSTVTWENVYSEGPDGVRNVEYIGPKLHRISPMDIVFDPLASDIHHTYKIIRSTKTIGEIERLIRDEPEQAFWADVLENRYKLRTSLSGYSVEDFNKACAYQADGFGNMFDYFQGDVVEVLEFYGDFLDGEGRLQVNKIITIADRCKTVRVVDIPSWLGQAPFQHVGWRFRTDNLWAMGPLDNLVGMQYRIDHLENAKADAFDLMIHPPLKIIGDVEEFNWSPGAEVYCGEGGDVQEILKNINNVAAADNQITLLENKMELYAGAPRDAMGIRTPGEKTAFEVQQLMTAAGRIFQEKIVQFETELLEPALNTMLESAKRNMDVVDTIGVIDDDLNAKLFMQVNRNDITANGVIRPIGARHFAKQQQDLQNLIGVFNSPVGQMIAPHTSSLAMTKLIEDVTSLSGYKLFSPNVALFEQMETQRIISQGQEDLAVEQAVPPPEQQV